MFSMACVSRATTVLVSMAFTSTLPTALVCEELPTQERPRKVWRAHGGWRVRVRVVVVVMVVR